MSPSLAAKASKNKTAEQGYGGVDTYDLGSKSTSDHADILELQRSAGNRAVNQALKSSVTSPGNVQGKLTIGQPGDKYEQEADRIADQVMLMPESEVSTSTPSVTPIQTQSVQRDGASGQAPTVTPSVQAKIEGLQRGGGEPLPADVRDFMEPRLSRDLSHIRVHTGSLAADTTKELNARAFATGSHIVFGAGQFRPSGDRLLAHELVHTLQQAESNQPLIQRVPLGTEATIPESSTKQAKNFLEYLLRIPEVRAIEIISGISDTVLLYQLRNALAGYKSASNETSTKLRKIYNELTRQLNAAVRRKEETARQSHESEKTGLHRAQRSKKRAERKAQVSRLTGEAPPTSTREAISQLNIARAGATVDQTNFEASTRILGQVSDWLYTLQTPESIDKHFGLRGYNKTAASVIANNAYSKVSALHETVMLISRGGRDRPMSDGPWNLALNAVHAAAPYLRTLADEKSEDDEELFETTETAGHIKASAIASLPALPLLYQGGIAVGTAAASGASAIATEAGFLTRLVPVFARDPRVAVTLLSSQIALKPDFYYGAFEGLVGSVIAVAEVGGPKKFVEKASTPAGAAEMAGQILLVLLTHGAPGGGRGKSGASTPKGQKLPETESRPPTLEASAPKKQMSDP